MLLGVAPVAFALVSNPALTQGVMIQDGFVTGQKYVQMDQSSRNHYVLGLVDGMVSDGHCFPGLIDERVPSVAAVIDDVVEGFEDAVQALSGLV